MEDLNAALASLARNAVRLSIGTGEGAAVGRFGGAPDVPEGFDWPRFVTDTYTDSEVKPRSLTFLAQFDCAALAPLDRDGLLPREGVLSFFYETVSQRWGYGPEDAGCARVYWFPNQTALRPAEFPADLEEYCRFPALPIQGRAVTEYPGYEEFAGQLDLLKSCQRKGQNPWEVFGEFRAAQPDYREVPPPWHRLLGWPDIIQSAIAQECALVSRGYATGRGFQEIPEAVLRETEGAFLDEWRLLFQLDSGVPAGDFSLEFGDSGSIYFYIQKEDLAARRFDRVWLVLQCC
ncbi:MAG: DUF1963 domain-containing protein [Oscillibacter sp.]|nr:DUF1963 domain-containing protein [Oscillibacter sp.]